ncbi:hypothetical protein COU62_04335 [Candidatus Pacearchaeota archaeon CG10_big_fil_rev_8_21_14_0_10_35_219]|nr:insulinase family protein [Candidatus Pacearchaeota archaeon]OIO42194.1 MAG: hypothetical protein AUJ63_02845 [Candidatus Pacearchaeota archaeon CG1_02_35_32]PIO07337.1 MAG: hypothetical protein COU62_04335 [Candidatus Pacearchaeota archaeon CG10_big_fil_rev_8_21_14_0_10_35_219]PIY81610.1 MAG: hypothetical protein COY79_01750 [Candidatus Pacearchaeota archaeon CG_4_10_14_0_8_um_filter_35_169]PIZ80769.1 MAG: hypothetical protein COY00_00425 [Candidatus Pacearchaeota archaeon CG_4_10_14_0_2_um
MQLKKRRLKNGITVLFEKRDLPVVSFSISNRFGGSYETEKIKGIAHFTEHLLFTGTKSRTHEDISREIEKRGGILNAFTANDITSYWFKLPAEHLFKGMDILTDILKNTTFDEKKFEKEKKVILEEIKMYHDIPQRHIYEKIIENLYEKPFGIGIIGTKETVSSLTKDFVSDYFKSHYNPENYIVTIIGQADIDKVCEYLESNFESTNKKMPEIKIEKLNKESTEERPGLDQAHFMFGVHAPMAGEKEHDILEVLDAYLANGMSSRLFLEIREKRGLAYAIRSSLETEKHYSYYTIYVGTAKESIPEVRSLIIEGFKNIDKMSQEDLKEAKERLIGLKKVSSEESVNVMNELMFLELTTKAENYYTYEEDINKVTLEEVKSLAKKMIKKYSTAAIVPK